MACGVPVVASTLDGSREAVRFGMLGQMVNPDDRTALSGAIIKALNSEKKIPEGLDYFSFANFQSRLQALVVAAISK
jgi:glycosyltransferase involved in cell wall biosynthesis